MGPFLIPWCLITGSCRVNSLETKAELASVEDTFIPGRHPPPIPVLPTVALPTAMGCLEALSCVQG